jgi:hypothetical protein
MPGTESNGKFRCLGMDPLRLIGASGENTKGDLLAEKATSGGFSSARCFANRLEEAATGENWQ